MSSLDPVQVSYLPYRRQGTVHQSLFIYPLLELLPAGGFFSGHEGQMRLVSLIVGSSYSSRSTYTKKCHTPGLSALAAAAKHSTCCRGDAQQRSIHHAVRGRRAVPSSRPHARASQWPRLSRGVRRPSARTVGRWKTQTWSSWSKRIAPALYALGRSRLPAKARAWANAN